MKLPVIKHIIEFIEKNDEDYINETIEVIEHLCMLQSLKDEELEVLGEILSNLYGSIEVNKEIKRGISKKEALNKFMNRVIKTIE
jgi:hypothetical protein